MIIILMYIYIMIVIMLIKVMIICIYIYIHIQYNFMISNDSDFHCFCFNYLYNQFVSIKCMVLILTLLSLWQIFPSWCTFLDRRENSMPVGVFSVNNNNGTVTTIQICGGFLEYQFVYLKNHLFIDAVTVYNNSNESYLQQ